MSDEIKQHRVEGAIRELAAQFLARTSNKTSLITVTGIDLSADGKRATILISVLPEHAMDGALDFANRHRDDFRDLLKERARLRIIPAIIFAKDKGEENRRKIDGLLAKE